MLTNLVDGVIRGEGLKIEGWTWSCSEEGNASFKLPRLMNRARGGVAQGSKIEDSEAEC